MPWWDSYIKSNPDVCLDCNGEDACDTCAWVWFQMAWVERKHCEVPAYYWWAATKYGGKRVAISIMRAGWHSSVRKFKNKRRKVDAAATK